MIPLERANILFYFSNDDYSRQAGRAITWLDDVCQMDDSFCPVEPHDERTYRGELDLSGTAEAWSRPGAMNIYIRNDRDGTMVHADIPMVGHG